MMHSALGLAVIVGFLIVAAGAVYVILRAYGAREVAPDHPTHPDDGAQAEQRARELREDHHRPGTND